MELYKTKFSQDKGKGKLDKILLKCNETNYYESTYYELIKYAHMTDNEHLMLLVALYESEVDSILKFGILNNIEKELMVCNEVVELPNFIRYFCVIKCDENMKNIIINKNTINDYKMDHSEDNSDGFLIMKYHDIGCMQNYNWNVYNFELYTKTYHVIV